MNIDYMKIIIMLTYVLLITVLLKFFTRYSLIIYILIAVLSDIFIIYISISEILYQYSNQSW